MDAEAFFVSTGRYSRVGAEGKAPSLYTLNETTASAGIHIACKLGLHLLSCKNSRGNGTIVFVPHVYDWKGRHFVER